MPEFFLPSGSVDFGSVDADYGAVAQGVEAEDWWAAVRVGRSCKSVQCKLQGTEWQHGGGAAQGGS